MNNSDDKVMIGGFRGADGITGPPLMVHESMIENGRYVGPFPPDGWTYAKDGYAFIENARGK